MVSQTSSLRVALLAGTLTQGGAEKQLLYMAGALQKAGVRVRVYSLTCGEFYEAELRAMGLNPVWVGRAGNPALRVVALLRELSAFRPQIVQSAHAYTNLHVALVGRLVGAITLGAIRSDLQLTSDSYGRWTPLLIGAPMALVVNSRTALRELVQHRKAPRRRLFYIPNAVDLERIDCLSSDAGLPDLPWTDGLTAIVVGRLVPVKRVEVFLQALALARRDLPLLHGLVVGDGPEREMLVARAMELGLGSDAVAFAGQVSDATPLLGRAHMLVLCSDHEGLPNVVLEGMAARLPVITTPAGDAPLLIQNNLAGFVVPFGDAEGLANRMSQLARCPELRKQLGEAGRRRVEERYGLAGLANRLLCIYEQMALANNHERLLRALRAQAAS